MPPPLQGPASLLPQSPSSISQHSGGLSADCPFVPCQARATSRARFTPHGPLHAWPSRLCPLGCVWGWSMMRACTHKAPRSTWVHTHVSTHTHSHTQKYQHTRAGSKALTHILLKGFHTNQENTHTLLETKAHKSIPPRCTCTHVHTYMHAHTRSGRYPIRSSLFQLPPPLPTSSLCGRVSYCPRPSA